MMKLMFKIIVCFCLLAVCNTYGQTYAKYTTQKAKAAPAAKPAKPKDEVARPANKPTAVVAKPTAKPEKPAAEVAKPVAKPETNTPEAAEVKMEEKPAEKKPAAPVLPPDFEKLMRKAHLEYKQKKFAAAEKTYTEAFAISPDTHKYFVLHLRAYCHYSLKNFDKAIADCTAAIEDPSLPNDNARGGILFLRSLSYNERKAPDDKEKACADYSKARATGFIQGEDLPGLDCK